MDPNHSHQWHSLPPMPPYPAAPPPPPYPAPPPPYPAPPPPYTPPPPPHLPFRPPQIPFQPQFHYPPPPLPQHPPPPPPPPLNPILPPPRNPIPNPENPMFNHYSNPNSNSYSAYSHGAKRSRVQEPLDNLSADDERRLKLIREHGGFGLTSCTSFDKPDSCDSRGFEFSNVDRISRIDQDSMYRDESSSNRSIISDSINRYRNEQGGMSRLCDNGLSYRNEQGGQVFHGHAFSASPSPPLPQQEGECLGRRLPEAMVTSPSGRSLFPSSASKVAKYPPLPEPAPFPSTYLPNKGIQTIHHALPKTYPRELEQLSSQYSTSNEQKIVDASLLLKHPHRTTRPDHIVVILRGFPGSGKSYLAKMLRDLEAENGGQAPRIHTMDDYFMMEVEKIDESEGSKSSSSVRGRKPATKTVMEYCYEPEMEEAYRSSMLKAFKKTLDEGVYSFIIVDDRNLRVADFVQFWATAKRSGYEVYLLEAAYKDPAGCAARNIHGFTQDDIRKMADQWEEAPSMYLQLDIKSLLHGDKFLDSEIQEVDMDTGEGDASCVPSCSDESNTGRVGENPTSNGPPRDDQRHDATGSLCQKEDEAKELGKSKWSNDLEEDDAPIHHGRGGKVNPLPVLNQSYRKKGKSVRWGDQVANTGFSIGAAKMAYASSLVIGPGSGYNLNTNPLAEADKMSLRQNTGKMQNILREQLRAEHESFKAVFDKRKQRIGGFDLDEE